MAAHRKEAVKRSNDKTNVEYDAASSEVVNGLQDSKIAMSSKLCIFA